jgi:S-formylglutathione hydrolase FrmB
MPNEGMSVVRRSLGAVLVFIIWTPSTPAVFPLGWFRSAQTLDEINRKLHGKVLDFTFNHGCDRRIYSAALDAKRDLYVYLPPGYDPSQKYPLVFFLHGFSQDENTFLKFVTQFDQQIACGHLPPLIVVAPDGSIRGRATLLNGGSFYVNSKAGRFEDYIMRDVWEFMHRRFPIRPEREAHVMLGGSMGGFGAYYLSIKHRDRIGVVAAVFPPLNLRYLDCHGRYFSNFDPNCYSWRTRIRYFAPIGRYYGGLVTIREHRLIRPLYGLSRDATAVLAPNNPVEMLESYNVQPGELEMFVGYVGRDEFNLDAQVESFLYFARCRGLQVSSVYLPDGKHSIESARKLLNPLLIWLSPRIAPYSPQ